MITVPLSAAKEFGIVWYTMLPTTCVKLPGGRPEFYVHRVSFQSLSSTSPSSRKRRAPT